MTENHVGLTDPKRLRRPAGWLATAAVLAVVVAFVHGPSRHLALTGDSYQWVQHAHAAGHRPALLLADLDTFLRPSTTWSLMVDRALWGGFEARGFRTSSLALHVLVALAFAVAGRRLGLGAVAAAVVAVVWATSPFTDESVFVVAYRFQPLLLVAWLVLIAVWPTAGSSWSRGRVTLAVLAVLAAAAAKETWVVTPALVVALEADRRRPWRAAIRPAALVGIAVAVYVTGYFLAFPSGKSYYELGVHALAKIPSQLAAFCYLDEPMPFALSLTWTGGLASVVVVALAASCVRWRTPGAWVALALLVLPTLPTLMVPYMPQRYLAIPYAGFLLLVALWIRAAGERLPRFRTAIAAAAVLLAVLVTAAGGALVRADLEDYREMAAAHARLLDEAAAVAATVAAGSPVIVVRDEAAQPLLDILREPRGLPKLPFTRHRDPYGLVDAAALFEWVIADEGTRVEHDSGRRGGAASDRGEVLVHIDGGFVDAGPTSDLEAETVRWRSAGRRFRVIRAVALD